MMGRHDEALNVLLEGEKAATNYYGTDFEGLSSVWQGIFMLYRDKGQYAKAVEYIKKAVAAKPSADQYGMWAGIDKIPHPEKIELYDKGLKLNPNHMSSFCLRYHAYSLVGDWDKMSRDQKQVEDYMSFAIQQRKRTDQYCLQPYHTTYLPFSAELLRETAKMMAAIEGRVTDEEVLAPITSNQGLAQFGADGKRIRKLKIGYMSGDFNQHPVGRNFLGVLLAHSAKRFEIFCFSTKHAAKDPITQAIMKACEYVDLTAGNTKSHGEIARMIREDYKIDVLVDLSGWTAGRRTEVFAAKPAPVQMTHGLGFVGTTGVEAFDYFISDSVASPVRFDEYYTENVVRLPQAYLPAAHRTVRFTDADTDPKSADKTALRKQNKLPESEDIFVYCSFQSIHKMSPESFDSWMRIMQNSPNSVLWMVALKDYVQERLLKRAREDFQIGSDRFIFGEPEQVDKHLIRAQACDLHLDSWPYNAHSTAMDVIWAGVPILVYLPDYHDPNSATQVPKMCSRVSASLLHTLGMPQLIMSTLGGFENEAVRLSNDREAYEKLRNDLLEKRLSSRLFDLLSYARHHEAAYAEAYERFLKGEAPSAMEIPILPAEVKRYNSTGAT
jgi:predicted O-linked N-acetylglucosamine transferase (SPINDLY family)